MSERKDLNQKHWQSYSYIWPFAKGSDITKKGRTLLNELLGLYPTPKFNTDPVNTTVYVTHGGKHHEDEVLGYVTAKKSGKVGSYVRLHDRGQFDLDWIKSEYPESIICDIMRQYDHDKGFYDHHQGGVTRPEGYPYATAGLMWKHYGHDAIINTLESFDIDTDIPYLDSIHADVDNELFRGVDAQDDSATFDNSATVGSEYDGSILPISVLTLSDVVGMLNVTSNDPDKSDKAFDKAVELNDRVLTKIIMRSYSKYRDLDHFKTYAQFYFDGKAALMDTQVNLAGILESYPDLLYIISPSNNPQSEYSMIALPRVMGKRPLRKRIMSSEEAGMDLFVHKSGFLAGADTIGDLIELARKTIEQC